MVNEISGGGSSGGYNTSKNNENSNESYVNLPVGYIPIGKIYIENNEILIFSVKEDNSLSEIGIMDDYGKYTSLVNTDVLNFRVEHQIQATYRLRKGCERNVYWVDDFNAPRYLNIDRLDLFKDENTGDYVANRFNLIKIPTQIPKFNNIEVLEGVGTLNPGSYTVSIQYVDENYNATNWLNSTDSIVIYNSSLSDSYQNIGGSFFSFSGIANGDNPLSMGRTSKAIKIQVSNLDTTFPYYRLGFSIADSGTGFATKAVVTEVLSIQNKSYILSTLSNTTEVALEELSFEKALINKAKTIEQHENLLLLGNTAGWEGDLCKFQKYASKIKADCIIEKASATSVQVPGNIKNPLLNVNDIMGETGAGYMPGEIYSFGIVYITKSGFITPVFHIPGKAPGEPLSNTTFYKKEGLEIFPMSNIGNSCQEAEYSSLGSCNNSTYWGYDSEGILLEGKKIRHHKFPERKEIKKPLVDVEGDLLSVSLVQATLSLSSTFNGFATISETEETYPSDIIVDYTYKVLDSSSTQIGDIREGSFVGSGVDLFIFSDGLTSKTLEISSPIVEGAVIEILSVSITYYKKVGEVWELVENEVVSESETDTIYSSSYNPSASQTGIKNYQVHKLGIIFSGIEFPTPEELGVEDEIVGYYIVRNQRTEDNKTIVDSGILTPCSQANSDAKVLGYSSYVAPSLLMPEEGGTGEINNRFWNIITPKNKFFGTKLVEGLYTIEQQGYFERVGPPLRSRTRYSDVLDGSSYASASDKSKLSNKNLDEGTVSPPGNPHSKGLDGWCFKMACRDNLLNFGTINSGFTILPEHQKKIYTLKGMEYDTTQKDPTKCIYNNQTDSVNQIIELTDEGLVTGPTYDGTLPYVVIKKEVAEPYATFTSLPYYKEVTNIQSSENDTCICFSGDSYISSLRYNSVVKYQNRTPELLAKAQLSKWIAWTVIVVSVIAAAIITYFTAGAAGASAIAIVSGIASSLTVIGGGIWAATSVLGNSKWIENYENAYRDGLWKTVSDDWTQKEFEGNYGTFYHGRNYSSPSDDELQYTSDCLTDVWFESEINMGLRVKGQGDSSFLGSPGKIESGRFYGELIQDRKDTSGWDAIYNSTTITWLMTRGVNDPQGSYRIPQSTLENFSNNKCLIPDLSRNHGKAFTGTALGEAYIINPDFQRRGGSTTYFHLPLTYSCCSNCNENFPHRFYWSEQSFQEELVDNYSLFKENNYRDLDGETGEIVNIFKIMNQLFIHTKEALWEVPKNYQEKVTDQIVSFIGTGSLYDIPPRRIVEGQSGMSAGLWHKESALLTEHGYFFVCEKQRKIYHFNGSQLISISNNGLETWFKENIELKMSSDYKKANGRDYPFDDNPSNKYGCGFISTYDSYKNRILFTKKDFQFKESVVGTDDFELCVKDGNLIISRNYNQTIEDIITPQPEDPNNPIGEWSEYLQETVYPITGWRYLGIEDCKLKFERNIKREKQETRYTTEVISNNTIIFVYYDTTSMTSVVRYNLKKEIVKWYIGLRPEDEIYQIPITGAELTKVTIDNIDTVFFPASMEGDATANSDNYCSTNLFRHRNNGTERWLNFPFEAYTEVGNNSDIMVISFVDESNSGKDLEGNLQGYHSYTYTDNLGGQPSPTYTTDFTTFTETVYPNLKSFIGIDYPIVRNSNECKAYLQHAIAAIYGHNLSQVEADALLPNAQFTEEDWNTYIKEQLISNNPYSTLLASSSGNPGLLGFNFLVKTDKTNNNLPDAETFGNDIDSLLASITVEKETEVTVNYIDIDLMYIEGEEVEDAIQYNNSWTISYDLNSQKWISWHSYLPSMYFFLSNKFYSWKYGNSSIWKHNIKGSYQTFYGELYPFIIDYISLSTPLLTRLFDSLRLICGVEKFDNETKEFVDVDTIFFNKLIAYNSRQCTGELNIKVKKEQLTEEFLWEQVNNLVNNEIIVDNREKVWFINNLRDVRVDYTKSIFSTDPLLRQDGYYIDKILNEDSLDFDKDWNELESLRDKYLAVRFIFDKFANIKMSLNFSDENEKISIR